ncbi:uncharacterized protein TNCV_1302291 [Trichonephila clavipes]|nr:uncharacterized protein TNCV_1302291 [Trichonephila clavipes]
MFQRRREAHEKKRKCGTAPEVRRPGAPEGRGLIWLLHLQALAEQNGVAFTPWVALPGVDTPDVHRPLRPGTPPRHFEAACRTIDMSYYSEINGVGRTERKLQKGSKHRVPKRNLSSNDTNSVLPKNRKKSRREETVAPTTSGYNLRQRIGKREESRPTIERKAQKGGPVRSRKGRERNDSPYIEERTRSSNKNARRGGDQQRQDQERRGTWTKKSLSLEVLVGNANYKS